MKQQLQAIKELAEKELSQTLGNADLDALKIKFLGKKGELTAILKQMGKLSAEERPVIGQLANEIRYQLETEIEERRKQLKEKELEIKLKEERIDVTMPGERHELGHKHPLSIVLDEVKEIFLGMGFDIATGPEVEWDYYNFEALRIRSISRTKCFSEHRPLPFRSVLWSRRSLPFESSLRAEFTVRTRLTRRTLPSSIRLRVLS